MKLVYLHQYFVTPDKPGGTRSYEIARRLVQEGHEVHLITSWRGPTEARGWRQEDIDGIQVHWIPVPYDNKMGFARRVWSFLRFAVRAGLRAKSVGGDIVFSTSTPLTIALPGLYAASRLHVPHVFEVRDLWPELPIAIGDLTSRPAIVAARWLEKLAYKRSSAVIALSPGMADGVVDSGYPRDQVVVAPNFCDNRRFDPAHADVAGRRFRAERPELGDSRIVLYAGTLGRINGVGVLVDIAADLLGRDMDIAFVIVGAGAELTMVRERAELNGTLDRNVFFYEPIPKDSMVDAFHAASLSTSLFVGLPEMENNSANKFFDGLASGTAVAINYGGWQADLLTAHAAGLVLDREPAQAAAQIADLIGDEGARIAMANRARQLAEGQFDRDLLTDRILATLEEVALGGQS